MELFEIELHVEPESKFKQKKEEEEETFSHILCDQNGIKLEINNKKKTIQIIKN